MKIELIFTGEPKAVQSFRFTKSGKKYQEKSVKDWKRIISMTAIATLPSGFKTFEKEVGIKRALFVFSPPERLNKSLKEHLSNGGLIYKSTKPDLTDNLFKGLIDALAGIVYERDQQICSIENVKKCWGLNPRIEIEFEEIDSVMVIEDEQKA